MSYFRMPVVGALEALLVDSCGRRPPTPSHPDSSGGQGDRKRRSQSARAPPSASGTFPGAATPRRGGGGGGGGAWIDPSWQAASSGARLQTPLSLSPPAPLRWAEWRALNRIPNLRRPFGGRNTWCMLAFHSRCSSWCRAGPSPPLF